MTPDNKPAAPGLEDAFERVMQAAMNMAHVYSFVGDDSLPIAKRELENVLRAALSHPVPAAAPAVEPRVTEEMITAYLTANDAYWKRIDGEPTKLGKWRNGTPSEATRISLEAALSTLPASPEPAAAPAVEPSTRERFLGCLRHVAALKHEPRLSIDEVMTAYDYTHSATLPASPEPATQGAAKPVHTDHPFQHWDRTCPACVLEASPPAPEPLTPAAGVSDQQIMKIHHESFEPMQGRKNSYMLNPIKFARAVLALPTEKQGD